MLKQSQYHVTDLLLNSEYMKITIVWVVSLRSYWMRLCCPSVCHVFGYFGRHFVNLSNGLWTMVYFVYCIFLLIYESSVILILICFNITAVAQFFPYNAWCDLSSTLGSLHPWWSVVEFFTNCWNTFSAQISFFWLLQYSLQSISFQSPTKTSP